VNLSIDNGKLFFSFTPEDQDITVINDKVRMDNRYCYVQMPEDFNLDNVHPDAIALAVILMIDPFCSSIKLPFKISEVFQQTYEKVTKKKIGPIDPSLSPRIAPVNSLPACAFSGGVDSTAAVELLPKSTVLCFLDRTPNEKSLYNKDAAYYACEMMEQQGYMVHKIETNLEFIRSPVGFPVDFSNSVPAVLLSDYIGFDSIAFGMILESAYRIGSGTFEDYSQRSHYKKWNALFSAIDMPLNLVVAGISEVGTSLISLKSSYGKYAQSCMRGVREKPCMNCWKCFRKILLENALKRIKLTDADLDGYFRIKSAQNAIMTMPIKHENVLTYTTHNYDGDHKAMNALKRKVRGDFDEVNIKWMEKWYNPSAILIHPKYRESVINN
ncbi:DUF6395 domain-containing protein, partial [Paenibacillus sp. oral taxon 786]|uniref:DUF6395 domain-containing protein n=1 Tax=Paenibacillus sp. oral taxon 786 TaxID=652715 RepID=UPI0005627FF7